MDLAATSTGAAVLGLLAIAGGEGSADEVVAFLRGPGRARPSSVDWLERRVRRERRATAADALEIWRDGERDRGIWELDALAEAGAGVPRDPRAHRRRHRRAAPPPLGGRPVQRPVDRAAGRRGDLPGAGGGGGARRARTHRMPRSASCSLTSGSRSGAARPRVASASSARTGCGQRGWTTSSSPASPTAPSRPAGAAIRCSPTSGAGRSGLAARRDPAAEERYLFHACVSRPERRLHLSYPVERRGRHPPAQEPVRRRGPLAARAAAGGRAGRRRGRGRDRDPRGGGRRRPGSG